MVNHPSIVTVYRVIRKPGMDSIVMEYIPGKPLDQVIPKRGLALKPCLHYAMQIAQALRAVHRGHMVYRDLKPANILVTDDQIVKLVDFGLIKVMDGDDRSRPRRSGPKVPPTVEGTILGTVGYMSPEQVRGQRADQRSDLFSFGTILYEMLTGRRAFQKDTPIDTMHAILHKTPADLPVRIPMRIGKIVRRCLEKDPRRRYQAIAALIDDLTLAAET
jgi:serine/threonine-protein kinase